MTKRYASATTYDLGETCFGTTTNIEFQAKSQVQGVDPETDTTEACWEPRQIVLPSNKGWNPITGARPRIVQEANVGPGGLQGHYEPLIGWYNQEGHIGANGRPDLQMVLYTPNLWYKDFDYHFMTPAPSTSEPAPGLSFAQIGSPGAAFQIMTTGTSLGPELRIDATQNAGCRLTNPHALCYPSIKSQSHWIFRTWYPGNSRFRFGWRTADDQNRFEFWREDGAQEASWHARTVGGGATIKDVDTGVKTGAARIWFCLSYDQSLGNPSVNTLSAWIGTVPGEFPPGANVLKLRAEFQPNEIPNFGIGQYAPFFEWTNLGAATYQLALWRMRFWRT